MMYISQVSLVVFLSVIDPGSFQNYLPQVSPFFFLCNYHGNVQDIGRQMGEVKLSVTIEGNPDNYVPGKVYQSKSVIVSYPLVLLDGWMTCDFTVFFNSMSVISR